MTAAEAADIRAHRVKEIPLDLLRAYQDAAKPEQLNLNELKYFAPRYLELIANFQYPSFEPLLSLDRFGHFKTDVWSPKESALLDDYALAFCDMYLDQPAQAIKVSPMDILLMFHKGNFKLPPLLAIMEEVFMTRGLSHINRLLDNVKLSHLGELEVNDAFSDEQFDHAVGTWLNTDRIKGMFRLRIETAIMAPESHDLTDVELQGLSWKYEYFNG